jgi:hypothetical protein
MSELQDNPLRDLNNARNLPRDTPETDEMIFKWIYCGSLDISNFVEFSRRLERERDEAREALAEEKSNHDKTFLQLKRAEGKVFLNVERAEKLESENAKLRDIAERAIKLLTNPPALSVFPTLAIHNKEYGEHLRAELDQLTEGGE